MTSISLNGYDMQYFTVLTQILLLYPTVCMGSTFEDDCEEGDDIILCDGCNAEAHLRCLNMTVVRLSTSHTYCIK